MDTINMFSALKNVCPGPQEVYSSKHNNGHEPYKKGLYHIYGTYGTLYTLTTG